MAEHPITTQVKSELVRQAADHHQHGRLLEAVAVYNRIIEVKPDDVRAYADLGKALYQLGRYGEGLEVCNRAIAIDPENAELYYMRGYMLRASGRLEEAVASYDRSVALKPDHAQAHANRGNALYDLGRLDEALTSYNRAIALKPDYAQAHRNRGNVLQKLGRLDEALASYDLTLVLNPIDSDAHHERGTSLLELSRPDEALAAYKRAIMLAPNKVEAHYGHGFALCTLGRYAEGLVSLERATALQPQHAQAQFHRAVLLLLHGNYEEGFDAYEWRRRHGIRPRRFTQPQWRGESITDKTILLEAEQGLGDKIQMLRYLPLLKAKAARIILELPRTIQPLLGRMVDGVTVIEPLAPLPSFDVHCPLMSLPLAFGTQIDTIPAQVPYLSVPAERMAMWRSRLPKSVMPRIGLVWSGRPTHKNDRNRSIALERLAPLLNVSGVSFVSLQREYRDADLPALKDLPIERIDDMIHDLGDTAAAIEQCDLVISVDTSVAHLAGSLGKKLWLLLPFVPDWRWLLERTDSPWYPTARLFRQSKIGDWDSVVTAVVEELSIFLTEFVSTNKILQASDT